MSALHTMEAVIITGPQMDTANLVQRRRFCVAGR